jgi:viroplasmin and RNaseH domain-containing protein
MQCQAQVSGYPDNLYKCFDIVEDAISMYNRYNHGEKQGEEISKAIASITQKSTTTNPTMNVNRRDVVIAMLVLIIAIQSWVISKK